MNGKFENSIILSTKGGGRDFFHFLWAWHALERKCVLFKVLFLKPWF